MQPCPYCSRPLELVRVHGHDQCRHCGVNVEPCCNGETCDPSIASDEPQIQPVRVAPPPSSSN